jgi:ERCC4-related helicase
MPTATSFPAFFQTATGNSPYAWQEQLAEDSNCRSLLVNIPTGLGKTAV